MNPFIPIYDIFLKPHEVFRFYVTDLGQLCSVSNIEKPLVCIPNAIWDKSKGFVYGTYRDYKDTIQVPTWGVKKEDMDEHMSGQLMSLAKASLGIVPEDKFVLFVAQKELPHGLIEIGTFCPGNRGIGDFYQHNKQENIINRYLRLKVFW